MRSATLRWIILLTALAIGLLVSAQLFWLNKIYNYEQKEFSTSVVKSIQGVYEDLQLTTSNTTQLQKLIEQPDPNTFLFKIDSIPPKIMLLDDILDNFEDFQVFADCKVALYSPESQKYLYEMYLPSADTKHPKSSGIDLQPYKKDYAYVHLYFPNRHQYILNSMTWWITSGVLLLLVLVALSLSIFFLYRQKFLNEIQNDFIQNVTHEFQTPLTTLIVGLDAIAKPSIVEHPQRFEIYIKLMRAQTAYLKHHIENLMKVLKAEANGLIMDKREVIPNELIEKALVQLYAVVEEKHAIVKLLLEKNNTAIYADDSSLFVAIVNVISNALKYSKEPLIEIETKAINSKFSISIKDNGVGIEDKSRSKLFKKFYRVPSGDVHNVKGLGLGLYFVKKVIDGHKGTITVKSIAGKGSEFIIELPTQ
ncbi:sensor histidine kinase [Segetibacter koreensis]|uniref:sensor histidine kinase n=1 Tax=Segetibacter koreensis TaxID=398037 RepID=UPI00037C72F0|nr:HAMP domain-containing sensor histidine kinase [Segetibacter koreensis]